MAAPRIGIIGARCTSQGIGEHLARLLASLGANVAAIAGTRPQTVTEAAKTLRKRYGLRVNGYTDAAEMFAGERLDAVAICSPDQFHRLHLQMALAAGVHVLCEKPLVFESERDPIDDAAPIVAGFAERGLVLMVNEQWPYTIPTFDQLHPGHRRAGVAPRKFQVWLSPAAEGMEMIPRSLPHALSLLQAVCTQGEAAENLEMDYDTHKSGCASMTMRFDYVGRSCRTAVCVELSQTPEQPRPFGYAIDGAAVRRRIDMPGYRQSLEAAAPYEPVEGASIPRHVPIQDPLGLLLVDFLRKVAAKQPTTALDADNLLHRLRLFRDLYRFAELRHAELRHRLEAYATT